MLAVSNATLNKASLSLSLSLSLMTLPNFATNTTFKLEKTGESTLLIWVKEMFIQQLKLDHLFLETVPYKFITHMS